MKIKDIALLASFVAIVFVQEQALMLLPNIQFTTLLIVLYTKLLSFKKAVAVIIVYVFLDSLLWLGMGIVYVPTLLLGWLLIPVLLHTVFKRLETSLELAIFGLVFGFVYGWIQIPAAVLITNVPFIPYLVADIPFEAIMAISNFLTILWLYEPLHKRIKMIQSS